MDRTNRGTGAATLPAEENRVKEQIKRLQQYVWERHIDGSDHYDSSITDEEAIRVLDAYYSEIGNRNSSDQVYLGILLFEQAFEKPDEERDELFIRARKIFSFWRRVTGEDDWPAVEDRLSDINDHFQDGEPEPEVVVPEDEPAVAEPAPVALVAPETVEAPAIALPDGAPAPELGSLVVQPAPPEAAPERPERTERSERPERPERSERSERMERTERPERAERPDRPAEEVPEVPRAHVSSAAEDVQRRTAEEHARRREATEAFIADLPVVDGMRLIPAGTFLFGPEGREIFLDSFYVDQTPVTNAQYQRFIRETGYRPTRYGEDPRLTRPDQPVVGVSFGDARQFAKWAGKELPTELQWEKAGRGADGRDFPWGNDPPGASDACYGLDAETGVPADAGKNRRNISPFGVQDMAGTVWEWTTSPFAADSEYKVVRGGCYNDPIEFLVLTVRLEAHPKDKCEAIGFRCVRNIHH